MKNYWDEFEYDKLKLLLNYDKVKSVMDVLENKKLYDEYFPISTEIHLTDCCNLSCPWCTDKILRKNNATMPLESMEGLLEEFGRYGTGVTLEGGGEPTLHKNFREIVYAGERNHVDMGLITNGTIDVSDCISKLKWVRVSLDSSNGEEYFREKGVDKFEAVLNNLKKYAASRDPEKTYVGVGYVLTNRNQADLFETVTRLNDIGVDYIYFRPVEEAKDLMPTVDELLDLKKKLLGWTEGLRIKYLLNINERVIDKNAGLPCVAHSLTSIIHADGNVSLCEKRRHDEIKLGNIRNQTFEAIWTGDCRKTASQKLLECGNQKGCSVCRVTSFNMIFNHLKNINTSKFI